MSRCDDRTIRHLNEKLRKLGAYFSYVPENGSFYPMGKGMFLYDLDAYSRNFIAHNGDMQRLMDSARGNMSQRAKALRTDSLKQLAKLPDISIFSMEGKRYVGAVMGLSAKAEEAFELLYAEVKELPEKPVGVFLSQKDLSSYTGFAPSSDGSFTGSIKAALRKHLTPVVDSAGNPVRQTVRGQL